MKKSTTPASSNEPMGIVITMGTRIPVEPRVRAYFWGPAPEEPPASEPGTKAA